MQQPELSFIEEIARSAGDILRENYGKQIEVQHKSTADLVTAADKASEKFLIESILAKFPRHAINAEESGSHSGEANHQWFIDPLDGTLNFAHGVPFFSVSMGYACDGQLELGVIYDPLRDECFSAQCGRGAWLNGDMIQVSQTDKLIDCLLVTGFRHYLRDTPQNNFDNFARFSRITQGVRRLGSAALDLAYVAAGRLDGFWEVALHQWDVAAGALLVQEAGGIVTRMFGKPDFMAEPVSILAANPHIYPMMLAILEQERDKQG